MCGRRMECSDLEEGSLSLNAKFERFRNQWLKRSADGGLREPKGSRGLQGLWCSSIRKLGIWNLCWYNHQKLFEGDSFKSLELGDGQVIIRTISVFCASKKRWRWLPYVTVPCDIVGLVCYRDVSLSNSDQDEQYVPLVMNELWRSLIAMSSCELAIPAMRTTGGVFGCDPDTQFFAYIRLHT